MTAASLPRITVGLSSHRVEVLPAALELMGRQEAVVLEEAPEADFPAVLAGNVGLDDYLANQEVEFPRYSREQLLGLRRLHERGVRILQVEPYLERLIAIHEALAAGHPRGEVEAREEFREVYAAESRATAALLRFYRLAHTASFPEVVAAVQDFAQADAARFRLRDELRAQAIAPLVQDFRRLYVEAGYIHLYLVRALRRQLAGRAAIRPVFLLAPRSRALSGQPRPMGPGDLLTLNYIFGKKMGRATAARLAAQSLIHIQLLSKEELLPDWESTPHLLDEARARRLSTALTYPECQHLYPVVRRLGPAAAVAEVERYLASRGGGPAG
ncbi:MAG: hypothetical protein K6T55_01020 [Syntrophobacterales bacterium]|nr:hypothetical protein [Syntrophobacterales bacterium]